MGKLPLTYAKPSLCMARRVYMNVSQDSESLAPAQASATMDIGEM